MEAEQLISESKNIYIVPSEEDGGESIPVALALFYTLKNLNKNVNMLIQNFPEKLNYLIPSLDFISYPKNFVISIPNNTADVSQIYYEKTDENLKIHLTVNKGAVKKDNISFYYSDAKPDLIITLGIGDFKTYLSEKLDSFGFLLDSAIINIDNKQNNKNFGRVNLAGSKSLAEIIFGVIKNQNSESAKKEIAECLLTGLVAYTENFKKNITAEIFEMASNLMKQGADLKIITDNLKI